MRVDAPEVHQSLEQIGEIIARAPRGVQFQPPVLFHAAAGDGNGNLFLGVAPGKVREGMRVVQIGRDGKYVHSIRLLPTALPRLKDNSNVLGLSVQRRLSITGSTIATISEDGIVSLFRL